VRSLYVWPATATTLYNRHMTIRRKFRALPFRTIAVLSMIGAALVMGAVGLLFIYYWQSNDSTPQSEALATPEATEEVIPSPLPEPTADLGLGNVTLDSTGEYAFPVAADPKRFVWTHYHWDESHAVDIEIGPDVTFDEYNQLTRTTIVAIADGVALNYSGPTGGLGYMLQADDGLDYYYAHLSEQWVTDGTQVTVGQPLGVMGNTGKNAQYIEPHLHMSIGPRDTLWNQPASINAASRLQQLFGLTWITIPDTSLPYALPQGSPVQHPEIMIVTAFEQSAVSGLALPGIELGFTGTPPNSSLDIIATLDGEININRWTTLYGTRIQITNRASQSTTVVSGADEWLVYDHEIVSKGQVIGRWNPAKRPRLHYMIYRNGVIIDPAPTLDTAAQ